MKLAQSTCEPTISTYEKPAAMATGEKSPIAASSLVPSMRLTAMLSTKLQIFVAMTTNMLVTASLTKALRIILYLDSVSTENDPLLLRTGTDLKVITPYADPGPLRYKYKTTARAFQSVLRTSPLHRERSSAQKTFLL